jgi:hypothetical protein
MQASVKVTAVRLSVARGQVEADRSRVDDYYLTEGTGVAQRFAASPDLSVVDLGDLDGDVQEGVDHRPGPHSRYATWSAPRRRQRGAVRRDHRQRSQEVVLGRGAASRHRRGVRRIAGSGSGAGRRLGLPPTPPPEFLNPCVLLAQPAFQVGTGLFEEVVNGPLSVKSGVWDQAGPRRTRTTETKTETGRDPRDGRAPAR